MLGKLYSMSGFKKILLDGGNSFCYVTTVNGRCHLILSGPMSCRIDHMFTKVKMSAYETRNLQLLMQIVKHCTVKDGRIVVYRQLEVVLDKHAKDFAKLGVLKTIFEEDKEEKNMKSENASGSVKNVPAASDM